MRTRTARGVLVTAVMMTAAVIVPARSMAGGGEDTKGLMARPLAVSDSVEGFKSSTGKLAESSPSLLGRTDATVVNVMVKLDYDATASYAGDIDGLPATSPRVTGADLTGATAAEVSYESYTAGIDEEFRADVAQAIPSAQAGASIYRVYGGLAMQLPANQVDALLALPNVAAVQDNEPRQLRPTPARPSSGPPRSGARSTVRPAPARASSSAISTPASGPSTPRSPPTPASSGLRPPRPTARRAPATSATTR